MVKVKITSEWIQHDDDIGKQFKVTVRESSNGQILSEVTVDFPRWELLDLKKTTNINLDDVEKVAPEMSVKMAEQFIGDKLDLM